MNYLLIHVFRRPLLVVFEVDNHCDKCLPKQIHALVNVEILTNFLDNPLTNQKIDSLLHSKAITNTNRHKTYIILASQLNQREIFIYSLKDYYRVQYYH